MPVTASFPYAAGSFTGNTMTRLPLAPRAPRVISYHDFRASVDCQMPLPRRGEDRRFLLAGGADRSLVFLAAGLRYKMLLKKSRWLSFTRRRSIHDMDITEEARFCRWGLLGSSVLRLQPRLSASMARLFGRFSGLPGCLSRGDMRES